VLKISILDTPSQRRLTLEGRLIAPWAAELNLTAISEDGENALLELLREGIKFCSSGVFTKHVLKQLARSTRQYLGGK